jgi:lambda family phage portal protein
MTAWAQVPGSGIIAPEKLVRDYIGERYFAARRGAYSSASANNPATSEWRTSLGSADSDTLGDLPTLRAQSRDLIRNDALASGAVNGVTTNVVHTGIVPHARIDARYLGLSDEAASAWQDDAKRVFELWANETSADAARTANWWEQQQLVFRAKLESGDVFALRRFIPRAGVVFGTAVQLIEADRVCNPEIVPENCVMRGGIELDKYGSPRAYHIANTHPGENGMRSETTRIEAFDEFGQPIVLPIMSVKRIGQTRGVPYLSPVVQAIKQLSRYSEAEISASVISAMFAVFVTSPNPSGGPLASLGAARGLGALADEEAKPQNTRVLTPGMITDLAPGEDIKSAQMNRPNTAFEAFTQAVARWIGVGLEIPYEVLVKHFTSSYSASRAALIEAWKFYLIERDNLVTRFCAPTYAWVIAEAVATGLLAAPRFFEDPFARAAWLRCDWVGQAMPQIDPLKEAKAAEAWNKLGIQSRSYISSQQGLDWDLTTAQIRRENEIAAQQHLSNAAESDGQQENEEE